MILFFKHVMSVKNRKILKKIMLYYRRSFPSTELLSVEISLDSDSQRMEGTENGGEWCTGNLSLLPSTNLSINGRHTCTFQLNLLFYSSRKGLHALHDGFVWLFGFSPQLQIAGEPQVQWVPGQYQHREQSCPVSQLGGAKEILPTTKDNKKRTVLGRRKYALLWFL